MTEKFCHVIDCRYPSTHVTKGHQCGNCKKFGHGQVECTNQELVNSLLIHYKDNLPEYLRCKRPYCAHPYLHTTSAHTCISCKQFHSKYNCPTLDYFQQRKELELKESDPKLTQYNLKCPTCRKDCEISVEKNKVYSIDSECIICTTNKVDVYLPCRHVNICWECVKQMSNTSNESHQFMAVPPDASYETLNELFLKKYSGTDGKVFAVFYAGMGCNWLCRRNGIGEIIEIHFAHSDDHYCSHLINATEEFMDGYTKLD